MAVALTQDDYKLWTGETNTLSQSDWAKVVGVASSRLASLLCLEALPDPLPDDLSMLLANFICAVLRWQGTPDSSVSSKSVRNFTISFKSDSAVNAFAQVANNYSDIIGKYSACGTDFEVERTRRCACDGRF